jgi:MFS family permease
VISQVGDRIHTIAFLWFLYSLTGSALKTGVGLICTSLPGVILSPLAGSFADRHDRRTVMITADLVRCAAVAFMAYGAYAGTLSTVQLYGATIIISAASAFFNPALLSSVPNIVEDRHLPAANSLLQMSSHASGFVGPITGGLLIAAVGTGAAFAMNAGSFLASAVLLLGVRITRVAGGKGKNLAEDIIEGFKYIKERPTIGPLLGLFGVVNFFTVSTLVFLPIYVRLVLKADSAAFGLLNAMTYLGMLLASLYAALAPEPSRRAPLVAGGVFLMGLSYALVGLTASKAQSSVLLLIFGTSLGLINVYLIVMFQRMIPDRLRGRIFALINTVVFSLQPISYGIMGISADLLPVGHLFVLCGACIAVCSACLFAVPGFRDL